MKRFSIIAFVLVVAVLTADVSSVVAQVAPSIGQGSRVRITAPSLGLSEAVGTVQEVTDETFVIQFEFPRSVRPVERSEIAAMDVSIRRQRKVLKSVGVGLLSVRAAAWCSGSRAVTMKVLSWPSRPRRRQPFLGLGWG